MSEKLPEGVQAVRRRLPSPLVAVFVAAALAVGGLGAGSLLSLAASEALSTIGVQLDVIAATVVSTLLLQGVSFFGLSFMYLRVRGISPVEYVGVRVPDLEGWMYAASGYVLAFVAAFTIIFVVVVLLDLTPAQNRAAALGEEDPRVFLALIVLAFVLIGPGEEILYRGVIQSRLRETFSAPVAIALATALFAAVHAPALAGALSGRALTVTMLFFPGLVFGITYELTDNVVVPAAIHAAYNATLFSLAYLSLAFG